MIPMGRLAIGGWVLAIAALLALVGIVLVRPRIRDVQWTA